jgi:hypothetical protein
MQGTIVVLVVFVNPTKLSIDIYGQVEYADTVLDVMMGGKNNRTTRLLRDCNK